MSSLMPTYARYPVRLVRGEGLRVFDDAGRAYLDFAAGIAAMPLGHGHPAWVAAVADQLGRLVHVSNLFSTQPQEELAARLVALAGLDGGSVFLSNSGAEANEAALKLVRRDRAPEDRRTVVALEGSFHGRTFATLAATGQPAKGAPFQPLPQGFLHVPPNDAAALDRAVGEETAAVLIEPILGEGGIVPLDVDYLHAARRWCDERGALLVVDEVQTGIARTGTWFAFQQAGIRPDVVTSAKALGGGLPIGATIARPGLSFAPGEHASTFGGGPVPCAAALAVLGVIEDQGLRQNARDQGTRLRAGLDAALQAAGLPGRTRGAGLLLGAPVAPLAPKAVVLGLLERGFLASEAGPEVVRVTPPLTVDAAAVDAFCAAFGDVVDHTAPRPAEEARR